MISKESLIIGGVSFVGGFISGFITSKVTSKPKSEEESLEDDSEEDDEDAGMDNSEMASEDMAGDFESDDRSEIFEDDIEEEAEEEPEEEEEEKVPSDNDEKWRNVKSPFDTFIYEDFTILDTNSLSKEENEIVVNYLEFLRANRHTDDSEVVSKVCMLFAFMCSADINEDNLTKVLEDMVEIINIRQEEDE